MLYKTLGSTDLKVSAIGQGATHVGSYARYDDDAARERIKGWRIGIELGMNLIDTADMYGGGLSEELVGRAVKGIRDKVVLATKFNPRGGDTCSAVLAAAEESLRRLDTDHIDLYQVHFPNPLIPVEPVAEALTRLLTDGKVRHVGVSNFTTEDMQEIRSLLPPGIVSNQVEYNLVDRSPETEMLPYCRQNRITMIAYSPLGQGNLPMAEASLQYLKAMAEKYQKSVFQLALRWLVSKPNVIALTKASDAGHIRENAAAGQFEIDPDDLAAIDGLATPEVVHVPADEISLDSPDGRPTYTSLEEALRNAADLIPSPEMMAQDLVRRKSAKPIQLTGFKDPRGRYLYRLDPYDFLGQLRKYWAWVITYEKTKPIPALVIRHNIRSV
jgi:aryl-alcohol dehydrogenase-like predicted oxidoreductase